MSPLTLRSAPAGLALLAGLFGLSSPLAAAPQGDALQHMPPALRAQTLKGLAARPANTAEAAGQKLDTTPPVVTAFTARTTVDAGQTQNQLMVDLNVADDLSGLMFVNVTAVSPSGGQTRSTGHHMGGWPGFKGTLAFHFGIYTEPGLWTVTQVGGSDVNGNAFACEAACLAALGGNLQFTVTGSKADLLAPTLLSGKIMTPLISLSTPVKGTPSTPPFVRTQVAAADTGGSGTAGAYVTFCLADESTCISTWSENWVYAQKKSTLYGSTQLWGSIPVGDYLMKSVELHDHGGASVTYTSTVFGGSTDFGSYFPGGTVVYVSP